MWRPHSLIKGPLQKLRGSPDQRGMGAQSDFISEVFVPSERHREQQVNMAHTLIELGIAPEKAAAMLSIPQSSISGDKNP
jgi:hypothetical protein